MLEKVASGRLHPAKYKTKKRADTISAPAPEAAIFL
jgi:hypothetical protein